MLRFFKKYLRELTEEQENLIVSSFREEQFNKGELLFSPGDSNTRHYIVKEGLLRLYLIDNKGKEFNILFAKEDQLIGDLATPVPTNFYLEAIEDTVVFSTTEEKMQLLGQEIGVVFGADSYLRKAYIFLQQRLVWILTKTAEENYVLFREQHPDLVQRLAQYHIAAYLGVSAEFLSKSITRSLKKKRP